MTMQIETAVIFCIIGCILVLILKQYQKSYGVLLSIGICTVVMMTAMPQIERIFDTAENICERSGMENSYFRILCKAIGISYLTQLGTDICRDCGENAVGTAVEMCGRILLVMLSLPLFLTLAETVLEMMQ
ncbi:MAG: stage III sporulation protein AD [Oscillospiraceae bacterium]|nr:stage III sporulation protein AD [Oscillospiraceae bacterium]